MLVGWNGPGQRDLGMQLGDLIDLKAMLVIAAIFIPLERLLPHLNEQRTLRRHWLNDAVYLFLNGILIKLGLLVLVGGLMIGIGVIMPASVGATVRGQPIWLQTIHVVVLADIGFYLAHR